MLFLPVGRHIKLREKHLARIFHAREEVDDVVLFLVHSLLLLHAVGNALRLEDIAPKRFGNLNVVLDRRRVFQLSLLCHPDELLDIVPLTLEERGIIRYWIIRIVGRRNTADNSELLNSFSPVLKVGEWRLRIEKFDALDVLRTDRITPVGIKNIRNHARLVGRSKADVTRLLADDAHNATGILIKDNHADGKAEVLEVLTHTEEVTGEVVVQHEVFHLRLHLCSSKLRVIDKSAAIADFGIEHLASAHCLVRFNEVDDVVRHLIVTSPWNILHLVVDDDRRNVVLLLKDFTCLWEEGCGGVDARDCDNGS